MSKQWAPILHEPGERFGAWTIIGKAPSRPGVCGPVAYWFVRCDCGEEGEVKGLSLRSGYSSCCRACGHLKAGATRRAKGPTTPGGVRRKEQTEKVEGVAMLIREQGLTKEEAKTRNTLGWYGLKEGEAVTLHANALRAALTKAGVK